MTRKIWTPKEESKLRHLIGQGLTRKQIAAHFHDRAKKSVKSKIDRMGMSVDSRPPVSANTIPRWSQMTKDEQTAFDSQVLAANKKQLTLRQAFDFCDCSPGLLSLRTSALGVRFNHGSKNNVAVSLRPPRPTVRAANVDSYLQKKFRALGRDYGGPLGWSPSVPTGGMS